MADIHLGNSNYVEFILQHENISTLTLDQEPDGWRDDDLEIIRNKKYHGIFTQFTGGLKFRGEAKDFINKAYAIGGLNTNVFLIKRVLRKGESYIELSVEGVTIDPLKLVQKYRGVADFNTLKEKDGAVEIKFNSDELEQLIKSHESDEFEIERNNSIDNVGITKLNLNNCLIEGRDLGGFGEHTNQFFTYTSPQVNPFKEANPRFTIQSSFITKGFDRHVEVTDSIFGWNDRLGWQANLFYDDLIDSVPITSGLKVEIDVTARVGAIIGSGTPIAGFQLFLRLYRFISFDDTGVFQQGYHLSSFSSTHKTWNNDFDLTGEFTSFQGEFDFPVDLGVIRNKNAFALEFVALDSNGEIIQDGDVTGFVIKYEVSKWNIKVSETTRFDSDGRIYKFAFVNEVATRLMEILTGDKFKFYSKAFGRLKLPPSTGVSSYQDYNYVEDGEWGHIALISGFWIRTFTNDNPLYKSLTTSIKKQIESLQATFNIGIGIEDSEHGQRLRFEKLSHFYRDKVVVKLPNPVTNVSREVVPNMFYSGTSFGSDKGGDYELGLGLDEPNVKAEYVSPLRKTDRKYTKISKTRSDDTGMEILRRQPEYLDKTADRGGDLHNWYLDLKLGEKGPLYEQLNHEDALVQAPIGVFSPDTYKSWRFTPKRSMLRHGWVLRTGLEQSKYINQASDSVFTLANSNANINLETQYLPNVAPSETTDIVREKDPQLVRDLDRSILLPEKIKFTHPVDDDLMDIIMGTTTIEVGGEFEEIPNWYFKFQWVNEKEELETGFLVSLKPKKGQFEFWKSNENISSSSADDVVPITFESGLIVDGVFQLRVGGNGSIEWGDGSPDTNFSGQFVTLHHTYSNFDGQIKFFGTLTRLQSQTVGANLYHDIATLPDELIHYENLGVNESFGDIGGFNEGLISYQNDGLNTTSGVYATLPSTVNIYINKGLNVVSGDISDTNPDIVLYEVGGLSTINQYSVSVNFGANVFSFIHLPAVGSGLDSSEVDNILIDLFNGGNSMQSGSVIISGNNAARTSLSDPAVTGLQNLGISVTTN